jgi:hypothetical protein
VVWLGDFLHSTLSWWRSARISASSEARDRNSPMTTHQISLTISLLDEIRAIHAGGGFGSIIGRNSFQRPKEEALRMLGSVMDIYAAAPDRDRAH